MRLGKEKEPKNNSIIAKYLKNKNHPGGWFFVFPCEHQIKNAHLIIIANIDI